VPDMCFHIFSKEKKQPVRKGNLLFTPVNNKNFTESLINCEGVITGAGFETPAEALYLGKKLMCLPIRGQYEQHCNTAALEQFSVPVIPAISNDFGTQIKDWLSGPPQTSLSLHQSTANIIERVMEKGLAAAREKNIPNSLLVPAF